MNRRQCLIAVGAISTAAVAGCVEEDDLFIEEEPENESNDSEPEEPQRPELPVDPDDLQGFERYVVLMLEYQADLLEE